jgi:hypothetical protein
LANTPVQVFQDYDQPPDYKSVVVVGSVTHTHFITLPRTIHKGIAAFLDSNFETYLLNNLNKLHGLAKPELPAFINKTADNLLKLAPCGSAIAELRTSYVRDLVRAITFSNPRILKRMYLDGRYNRSAEAWPRVPRLSTQDWENEVHIAKKDLGLDDTLAAAAVVGNAEAVVFLLSQGASVLDWRNSEGCIGFGGSLKTAAASGNVKVLELLLKNAHREIAIHFTTLKEKIRFTRTIPRPTNWLDIQRAIQEAISCAIRADQAEATTVLFEFLPNTAHTYLPLIRARSYTWQTR